MSVAVIIAVIQAALDLFLRLHPSMADHEPVKEARAHLEQAKEKLEAFK